MVKAFHLHFCGNLLDFQASGGNEIFCSLADACEPVPIKRVIARLDKFIWHLRCSRLVLYPLYCPGDSMLHRVIEENKALEVRQTRRSSRIRLQIPVFVRGTDTSGSAFIELTKTLNISAFGACIASQHILRSNQTVHLTIPAPSPANPGLVPSETPPIIARVLRQNMLGETRLFGLEFLCPLDD